LALAVHLRGRDLGDHAGGRPARKRPVRPDFNRRPVGLEAEIEKLICGRIATRFVLDSKPIRSTVQIGLLSLLDLPRSRADTAV
jgi:hypothetical protein